MTSSNFDIHNELSEIANTFLENSMKEPYGPEVHNLLLSKNDEQDLQILNELKEQYVEAYKEAEDCVFSAAVTQILPDGIAANPNQPAYKARMAHLNFCTTSIKLAEQFAICSVKSYDKETVASWLPEDAKTPVYAEALSCINAVNLSDLCDYKRALA